MRTFYEEWRRLDSSISKGNSFDSRNLDTLAGETAKTECDKPIWQSQLPNFSKEDATAFLSVSFTNHCLILEKVKNLDERLFYIRRCAEEHMSVQTLKRSIASDEFHHQGALPNNFAKTLSPSVQAYRAVNAFKDEYPA